MTENPNLPQPAPELKRLDRFVGRWSMEGHLVGSDKTTIKGEATYRWLPGGFFLEQHVQLDFMGLEIDSLELIGYDPETDTFPSTVFSNLSPVPLPYRWDVRGDAVTITVSYAPLDATFTGSWREDGTFLGGWRPNLAPTRPRMFRTTSAGTVSSDSTFVGIGVETCSERMLQRPVPAPVFALLLPADRAPELADATSG